MQITIDPQLKALIPPLAADERRLLEESIRRDGVMSPLVLWERLNEHAQPYLEAARKGTKLWCKYCYGDRNHEIGPDGSIIVCKQCDHANANLYEKDYVLLDGHNRYEIATAAGIAWAEVPPVRMKFESRDAAIVWMVDNQVGRRNIQNIDKVPLLERKREIVEAAARERLKTSTGGATPQPKENFTEAGPQTRDILAAQIGISGPTYDALRTVSLDGAEELKQAVRDKRVGASTAAEIATLPKETQAEIAVLPKKELLAEVKKHVHVAQNSGENEWYTPERFILSAVSAMGSIDTDPASSEIANRTVKASKYFTKETNGLENKWCGNVWINPPYAQPLISQFCDAIATKYAAREFSQCIVLVNNATETAWFARLVSCASAICFISSRIKFIDPSGKASGAPLQGQAAIYIGENIASFTSEFSQHGFICHVVH